MSGSYGDIGGAEAIAPLGAGHSDQLLHAPKAASATPIAFGLIVLLVGCWLLSNAIGTPKVVLTGVTPDVVPYTGGSSVEIPGHDSTRPALLVVVVEGREGATLTGQSFISVADGHPLRRECPYVGPETIGRPGISATALMRECVGPADPGTALSLTLQSKVVNGIQKVVTDASFLVYDVPLDEVLTEIDPGYVRQALAIGLVGLAVMVWGIWRRLRYRRDLAAYRDELEARANAPVGSRPAADVG